MPKIGNTIGSRIGDKEFLFAGGIGGSLGGTSGGGGAFSPSDISGLMLWLDANDPATITQVAGAVSQWNDKSGNAKHATQGMAANQPTTAYLKLNNKAALTRQNLPDASEGSDTGKGFTITGLVYDSGRDVFWAGNFGKPAPGGTQETSQIVKLSNDGVTNLAAISIARIPQGVAYDMDTDELYYAGDTNKVYKINPNGTGEGVLFDPSLTINGLAYDSSRSEIWVSSAKTLNRYTKAGVLQDTLTLDIYDDIDHVYYDTDNDWLWVTYGVSGGWGMVLVVDAADGSTIKNYILKDAYAIEGIAVIGDTMYIANDGYYHSGDIADTANALNQLQSYSTAGTGVNALRFDGTSDYLDVPSLTTYGAKTVIIVHHPFSTGGGLLMNMGASGTRFYIRNQAFEAGATNLAVASPVFGQTLIQVAKVDGTGTTTEYLTVNGGAWQSSAVTRTGMATNFDLGRSPYASEYYKGLIIACMVYDHALTDAEINQIGQYISAKWGIAWVNI